jgi:hypothetical protein
VIELSDCEDCCAGPEQHKFVHHGVYECCECGLWQETLELGELTAEEIDFLKDDEI